AGKEREKDNGAAAARAWWTMIGGGVRIGGVVHCRRINLRHWSSQQLPGARDVGLAAGAGQQPVVADAMKPLWENVEQEAPDELAGGERHCAVPRLAVAAGILFAGGHAPRVGGHEAGVCHSDAVGVVGRESG